MFFAFNPLSAFSFFFDSDFSLVSTTFVCSASLLRVSRKDFFSLSTSAPSVLVFEFVFALFRGGRSKSSTSHSNSFSSSIGTNLGESPLSWSLSSSGLSSLLKRSAWSWLWSPSKLAAASFSLSSLLMAVFSVTPAFSLSSNSSVCKSSSRATELLTSLTTEATCTSSIESTAVLCKLSFSLTVPSSLSSDWCCSETCFSASTGESDCPLSSEFSISWLTDSVVWATARVSSSSSSSIESSSLSLLLLCCSSSSSILSSCHLSSSLSLLSSRCSSSSLSLCSSSLSLSSLSLVTSSTGESGV